MYGITCSLSRYCIQLQGRLTLGRGAWLLLVNHANLLCHVGLIPEVYASQPDLRTVSLRSIMIYWTRLQIKGNDRIQKYIHRFLWGKKKILRLEIARRHLRHFYLWSANSIPNLPTYKQAQEFEQWYERKKICEYQNSYSVRPSIVQKAFILR